MVGIVCFIPFCRGQIIRLNSDSSNAVAWLQKSKCPAGIGFRMLAVIELYKRKYGVKISARYIRGVGNKSADFLSRGKIPRWLKNSGCKCDIDLNTMADLLDNPPPAWVRTFVPQKPNYSAESSVIVPYKQNY